MYKYKIKVMEKLSKRGYTRPRLRKEKILSEGTMQRLKNNESVTLETLNIVCLILRCQLNEIIEIVPTDEEKIKYF